MRHPRFIAILGKRDPLGMRSEIELRAGLTGLDLVFKTGGLSIFSDRAPTVVLEAESGAILGAIRRKSPPMQDFVPDSEESKAIGARAGDLLIENCWGDYIALLAPADGDCAAIRSPFSDLACLHSEVGGMIVLASDRILLSQCTQREPTPHWNMIANHLLTQGLRQPQSCIEGIDELLWGSRLIAADSGARVEPCWTPWRFAAARETTGIDDLAEQLRDVVQSSVTAMVRGIDHAAVMLSGGLDSSILTSCLARTGKRVTCITLTSGDANGDERTYAALVAGSFGLPLHDGHHRLEDVDLFVSAAADLARPIARSFAQASRAAKQRLAKAAGAEAIFDGGGGDNLFCYLQSTAPVADRLLRTGLGPATFRTASDVALLTETSMVRILAMALRRAIRGPRFTWQNDERFLTAEAKMRAGPPLHPWLEAPKGALPGSAAHIAMIAVVEGLLETWDRDLPERALLVNQPLAEFCLSVPSWCWFENGHNRVLARRAFDSSLPPEIAWRRSKGTPDGFVARLFEVNRRSLRELLCDGRLAAEGLLDIDAMRAAIDRPGPVRGHDHIRLLRIADVEAWVRGL